MACSIIPPIETKGAAMAALTPLTLGGLFLGHTREFFEFLHDLAEDAGEAHREG
ncbi:MAG: hypothetical protein ACRD3Y_09820 [Bryobacteraceae bacterium]